ncbi:MAG: hypothetical protein LBT01_04845 [Spirochaetaceae bacterium]|jgi:hypothetical protein|nr:hypothetical protein [Spirochaetaceae bacterium]
MSNGRGVFGQGNGFRACDMQVKIDEGRGTMRSIENFELQFSLIADKG